MNMIEQEVIAQYLAGGYNGIMNVLALVVDDNTPANIVGFIMDEMNCGSLQNVLNK